MSWHPLVSILPDFWLESFSLSQLATVEVFSRLAPHQCETLQPRRFPQLESPPPPSLGHSLGQQWVWSCFSLCDHILTKPYRDPVSNAQFPLSIEFSREGVASLEELIGCGQSCQAPVTRNVCETPLMTFSVCVCVCVCVCVKE